MALFFTWDALFPQEQQVGLDQLYRESGLLNVLGWNMAQAESWVAWMVNRGFLQLDRLTGGGVALRLRETGVVVRGLYDELA
jgi:hypothetical protein